MKKKPDIFFSDFLKIHPIQLIFYHVLILKFCNICISIRGWQRDYRRDKKRGSDVYCWFIHNSGKGFIDGSYTSYILPQLDSFLTAIWEHECGS